MELQQLQQALLSPDTYLAILVAAGGIGKSALTYAWLKQMQPHYHGVQRVFAWSFYSQGSHDTQTSATPFFQVALPFFGWTGEIPKEDVAKGRALAKLLSQQAFLLILDGLEPLQQPTHILEGELKDTGLKALLEEVRLYGLGKRPSLILISSRQPLQELQEWEKERFMTIKLQTLPVADGVKVLRQLGVQGTETELARASEEMGGHALALVLLGKLLKTKFAGRIERRDQLPPLWEERKQGGHALRVLQFYTERYWRPKSAEPGLWEYLMWNLFGDPYQLETPEMAFLYLLGLFDRPMMLREKEVLVKQAKCAKPLVALDNAGWEVLEKNLEAAGLLLHTEEAERYYWDCHPFIRTYFGQRFQKTQPDLFRQAHRVLFDYYQATPKKHQPDTLAELEPLYRAVVHGCLAREYKRTLYDVYMKRILRGTGGEQHYSLHKLGAFSQDLTALAAFFPQGWSHPVQQGLSELNQAFLLSQASVCLMSLGRLGEAVEPRKASVELYNRLEVWGFASISAQNLVDLYLSLGQLAEASMVARRALQYAERSGSLSVQIVSHAYLATTWHRQGQLNQAKQSFQHADQKMLIFKYPQLAGLEGFWYCALLLDQAQSVAEYEVVLGRAKTSLKWHADAGEQRLLDISLDHLTLARALWRLKRNTEAATAFNQAVEGIRKAGKIQYLPIFLIDRANFYLQSSHLNLETAAHDLQEADSLIRRCGMKLYAVDSQLAWCRYYLKQAELGTARACWAWCRYYLKQTELGKARTYLERAKELIAVTGYHLRDKELEGLKQDLGN